MNLSQLASRYLNALTLCVHIALLVASLHFLHEADRYTSWIAFGLVSLALATIAWVFNLKRVFSITEYPTSNIASAAQGYVEISGIAHALLPTKSPLQGLHCVWSRYWVYVRDHNNIWRLADYRASEQNFEVEDATGRCQVDPTGAEVIASSRYEHIQNDHKYIEEILEEGSPLYLLGQLESITEQNTEQQIKQEVGQLLSKWKKSRHSFIARFDRDGNGEIDMQEWELARAQARIEVLAEKGILNQKELQLLRKPDDSRMFLISGISPRALRMHYLNWAHCHLFIAIMAGLIVLMFSYRHTGL